MTKEEILRIAAEQSARDAGCEPEDFFRGKTVFTDAVLGEGARKYLSEPFPCNFVTYGSGTVAAVKPEYRDLAERYLARFPGYECFETPALGLLNAEAEKRGLAVCFMAEYFLPDPALIPEPVCPYPTRVLTAADFPPLYLPEWSNALCKKRKELDVLGVGAYDGGKLIGLAACSADCDTMYQIGIDVLPPYRRRGIASALTATLARLILGRGKVPFYCAAWSNVASVRNAVRAGFRPAWIELTLKPKEFDGSVTDLSPLF